MEYFLKILDLIIKSSIVIGLVMLINEKKDKDDKDWYEETTRYIINDYAFNKLCWGTYIF